MKKPKAPKAPDPTQLIRAQEQARPNIINPFGSQTYTKGPDGQTSYTTEYSPAMRGLMDRSIGLAGRDSERVEKPAWMGDMQNAIGARVGARYGMKPPEGGGGAKGGSKPMQPPGGIIQGMPGQKPGGEFMTPMPQQPGENYSDPRKLMQKPGFGGSVPAPDPIGMPYSPEGAQPMQKPGFGGVSQMPMRPPEMYPQPTGPSEDIMQSAGEQTQPMPPMGMDPQRLGGGNPAHRNALMRMFGGSP